MGDNHMQAARLALLEYVRQGFGLPPRSGGAGFDLAPYLALLPGGKRAEHLYAILATVGRGQPPEAKLNPQPLALTRQAIMPGHGSPADVAKAFERELAGLHNPAVDFDVAAALVHKYAWAVPGRLGEAGVSLYEEFKLLAALVHASGAADQPAQAFMLVAGDFPGIQRAIYTITSKGAARSLRGRSAFLQLLEDAIVRRLVSELGVCWCNVVYAAGGNFLLLAPHNGAEEVVTDWTGRLSRGLLDSFQGDISFVAACQPLGAGDLYGEGFSAALSGLKQALGIAKQQPFAALAAADPDLLFAPTGGASEQHCAVCHYDPQPGEQLHRRDDDLWCDECVGFAALAEALAQEPRYLSISNSAAGGASWQKRLFDLTGWWYDFHSQPPADGRTFYTLNEPDFLPDGAAGFRFFATSQGVRDFDRIAKEAKGIERIGALRMDVDNLGRLFGEGLHPLSLTRLSAASAAMSVFFDGWLNVLCRDVEASENRANTLYLIYAGGDDLFIVGPWDLMPLLAQRVRDDLAEFTANNPAVTISAGVEVVPPHYPLYRAAERALEALDGGAKEHPGKNAISFLGKVVGWSADWQLVRAEADRLIALGEAGLPKALIQTVRAVYAQYEEARQAHPDQPYGRWEWMQAYRFNRLANQYSAHKNDIRALQMQLMTPESIHLAGLVARWADYLLRTKQGD